MFETRMSSATSRTRSKRLDLDNSAPALYPYRPRAGLYGPCSTSSTIVTVSTCSTVGSGAAQPEPDQVLAPEHGDERPQGHERTEGDAGLAALASRHDQPDSHHRPDEEPQEQADRDLAQAEPSDPEPDQAGEANITEAHPLRIDEPDKKKRDKGQPRTSSGT